MTSETTKKKREGSGKNCAVVGCKNTSKRLRKWKLATCELHAPETHEYCVCLQPYQMHRFPSGSGAEALAKRQQWVKNINRLEFKPSKYSTVCSLHFVEGRPTPNNPNPTINLGTNSDVHFEKHQFELLRMDGKRKLKNNAVPTIFGEKARQVTKSGNYRPIIPTPFPELQPRPPPNNVPHDHAYSAKAELEDLSGFFPGTDSNESNPNVDEQHGEADEDSFMQEDTVTTASSETNKTPDKLTKMRERLKSYQSTIHQLRRENAMLLKKKTKLEDSLHKMFGSDQIEALTRGGMRGVQWSEETLRKAYRLWMMCGSNGYECLLQQHYPIPSVRTLQRYEHRTASPELDEIVGTSRATLLPKEMFESGFHN